MFSMSMISARTPLPPAFIVTFTAMRNAMPRTPVFRLQTVSRNALSFSFHEKLSTWPTFAHSERARPGSEMRMHATSLTTLVPSTPTKPSGPLPTRPSKKPPRSFSIR